VSDRPVVKPALPRDRVLHLAVLRARDGLVHSRWNVRTYCMPIVFIVARDAALTVSVSANIRIRTGSSNRCRMGSRAPSLARPSRQCRRSSGYRVLPARRADPGRGARAVRESMSRRTPRRRARRRIRVPLHARRRRADDGGVPSPVHGHAAAIRHRQRQRVDVIDARSTPGTRHPTRVRGVPRAPTGRKGATGYGSASPSRFNNSASARHARSNMARCRLSLAPCARVSGSSTPVIRISACGRS
jgi:hypothetical protein